MLLAIGCSTCPASSFLAYVGEHIRDAMRRLGPLGAPKRCTYPTTLPYLHGEGALITGLLPKARISSYRGANRNATRSECVHIFGLVVKASSRMPSWTYCSAHATCLNFSKERTSVQSLPGYPNCCGNSCLLF